MINTKLISTPKKNGSGGSTTIIKAGSSGGGKSFEPHYLWGQYFDDTEDISGDLKNVKNIYASGNISADGNIIADGISANSLVVRDGINVDDLTTDTLQANTFRGSEVSAEKVYVGDSEKGQWIIEEDNDVNLKIHIAQDKQLHIQPNDEDVFSVDNDKVTISRKLDLTNQNDGTQIVMGTASTDNKNNNVKSIVEEGIYFTDNNNNVAIGITNNYVAVGADMGSPNFLSGSTGWRVQPDGTGEFQNLKVNGNLDVFVLTYNEMRATNGILLVTDCACVTDAIDRTINNIYQWVITLDEYPPFAVDDYVQLQYRVDDTRIFSFKGLVLAVNRDGDNTVTVQPLSGYEGTGTSTDDRGVTTFRTVDPATATGEYLIRIGNRTDTNRQTIIKLNPYDGGYIDFMTGLSSPTRLASNDSIADTLPTATRIGNLSGVVYKGTSLEGYGLFSDNAYLSGAIRNLAGKWELNADGSGQLASSHISWDKDGNLTITLGNKTIQEVISDAQTQIASDYTARISATAQSLTSDYTQKITNAQTTLNGTIASTKTELEGKITQSAESLTSDYSQRITDVGNNVTTVQSNLTQTANSLSARITQNTTDIGTNKTNITNVTADVSGLKTRVTSIEGANYVTQSQLEQTANSIRASVTANDYGKIKIGYADKWESGSTGGESAGKTYDQIKTSSTSRIRTKTLHHCTASTKVYCASGYQVDLIYFDGNMKVASSIESRWTEPNSSGYANISIPSSVKYIAILLKKSDNSNISASAAEAANVLITTDSVATAGEVKLAIEDGLSNFTVTADRINLNGYTSVNNNFAIDTSGNVSVNGNITAKTLKYGAVQVSGSYTINGAPASLYLITSTSMVSLTLPPPDLYNNYIVEIIPLKATCILQTQKPTNNLADEYIQYNGGSSKQYHISKTARVYAYGSFWYILDDIE